MGGGSSQVVREVATDLRYPFRIPYTVHMQVFRNGSSANAAALSSWGAGGNPCLWRGVQCDTVRGSWLW